MTTNRPVVRETATLGRVISRMGEQGVRFATRITLRVLLFFLIASSALSVAFLAFSASAYRVEWVPRDPWVAGVVCLLPFLPPLWALIKPAKVPIWIGMFTLLLPMVAGLRFHEGEAASYLVVFFTPWYIWAAIQLRAMRQQSAENL